MSDARPGKFVSIACDATGGLLALDEHGVIWALMMDGTSFSERQPYRWERCPANDARVGMREEINT